MPPPSPVVAALLDRLAPDQRAAATAPPGPVLCIAPAGSGKTTTLITRVAWLLDGGADASAITAIAFNKRAADELEARLAAVGVPGAEQVRVRTFHALGLEILREAEVGVDQLVERAAVLRALHPNAPTAALRRLDTHISRLKLDLRVSPEDVAADPEPGPLGNAFVAYERELADRNALDFDDLIARPLRLLETDPVALERWRARCHDLLVDEAQDLDRSQLDLALVLAAPANRIFLVGDDDQSIYGWRLADVRRVLGLAARLRGLRRVDLEVNYRCPRPVVERAVRLVERNSERFAKTVRPGPQAAGRLVLAPSSDDEVERAARVLEAWPDDATPRAILARTNHELAAAAVAAVEAQRPFRAAAVELLIESPYVDALLDRLACDGLDDAPLLLRLGSLRRAVARDVAAAAAPIEDTTTTADIAEALLGWAAAYATLKALRQAVVDARDRLARLRTDDAPLSLATAHATKGLEFDDVAVIDMDLHRFPSARTLQDASEPERALEEERRLAYVAWTRARRSLILCYDPVAPSPFLLEAFSPGELGLDPAAAV